MQRDNRFLRTRRRRKNGRERRNDRPDTVALTKNSYVRFRERPRFVHSDQAGRTLWAQSWVLRVIAGNAIRTVGH